MRMIRKVFLAAAAFLILGSSEINADYDNSDDSDFYDHLTFPEGVDPDFQIAWTNVPWKMFNNYFFSNFFLAISDEGWDCDDNQTGLLISQMYRGGKSIAEVLNEWDYRGQGKWDTRYWYRYWDMIAVINRQLEEFPTKGLAEQDRSRYEAEARVLRAYYYLQLVKLYGRLPLVTDPEGIYSATADLTMRSGYEICKFIVDDCNLVLQCEHLPWHQDAPGDVNRMTKGIACAIMSQASLYGASPLYCGDEDHWQWAYEVNKEAFDLLRANDYELYTLLNNPVTPTSRDAGFVCSYHEYFALNSYAGTHPEDKETIWGAPDKLKLVRNAGINQMPVFLDGHFKAGYVPTQELVDAYDMVATGEPIYDLANPYVDEKHSDININPKSGYNPKDPYTGRDPRFYATIFYNLARVNTRIISKSVQTYNNQEDWTGKQFGGQGGNCAIDRTSRMNTRTGYYNRKYLGDKAAATESQEEGNWKYFRLGEVYLNYAEAAIESGHVQEGLNLINEIRHRAGFDPSVDKSTDDKLTARLYLRHERQVELAHEEHRYFDVRRWKKLGDEIPEERYKTGMWITGTGKIATDFTYNRFQLNAYSDGDSEGDGSGGNEPDYSQYTFEAKNTLLSVPIPEVRRLVALTGKPAEYWQNPLYYDANDYSGIETVIDDVDDDHIRVYVKDNSVNIMTDGVCCIYNAAGMVVAKVYGGSTLKLDRGFYIAVSGGYRVKFAVK